MQRVHWTRMLVAYLVAVVTSSVTFLAQGAVVTTEQEVRLRQGLPGSVPCTVTRKLFAVYWKKGDAIETATTVVILDTFYNNGDISGPGFEDGRFTVASNYSLIVNNARSADSGRYFCEVSDYQTGSLYRSHSDVTVFDPPVITDARRLLQYGDQAILICQYEEPAYAIYWLKGDNYVDAERLVVLDLFYEVSQRKGPGYDQGGYNISDDFSLVINSTRVLDSGRYFCAVSDLATGRLLVNSTYIDVVATPQEPFPEIDTCVPITIYESVQTCEISEDSNTTMSLTCTVKRYYPNISLSFNNTSNMASMIQKSISSDSEGLLTQVVRIQLLVGSDPVTCTASGLPFGTTRTTQGVFTSTTTAGNQTDRNDVVTLPVRSNETAVAVCMSFLVVILVVIGGYLFYRLKLRNDKDTKYSTLLEEKGNLVPFVELWFMILSREETTEKHTMLLSRALQPLVGGIVPDDAEALIGLYKTPEDMYDALCDVTDEPRGPIQREDLFQCLNKCNLQDEVTRLEEFRNDASQRIPKNVIKRVIWEIDDRQKIEEILKSLEISQQFDDQPGSHEMDSKNFYVHAIESLDKWQEVNSKANPWVLLSYAMERVECKPTDRTFFRDGGPVSYVELWKLAHYKSTNDYVSKISKVGSILRNGHVRHEHNVRTLSEDDAYAELCQWKESASSSFEHQKDLLLAVLRANGLQDAVTHIRRSSDNESWEISPSIISILIWGINDVDQVDALMNELQRSPWPPSKPERKRDKESYYRGAIESLHRWSKEPYRCAPLVLLCLAAERAKCTPADREFFKESGLISYLELRELIHFHGGETNLRQISKMCDELLENESYSKCTAEAATSGELRKKVTSGKDSGGSPSTGKLMETDTLEKDRDKTSWTGQITEDDALGKGADDNSKSGTLTENDTAGDRTDEDPTTGDLVAGGSTTKEKLTGEAASRKDTDGAPTVRALYDKLWKWKQISSSDDHQMALLMAALKAHGLSSVARYITECRANLQVNLTSDMIKDLIDSLDQTTMTKFVQELLGHKHTVGKEISTKNAIQAAVQWSQGSFRMNPLIEIDLALEKAGREELAGDFVKDFHMSVTFVELWNTLQFIERKGQLPKVEFVLNSLFKRPHSSQLASLSIKDMYKKLCEWKRGCSSCFQIIVLKAVLKENGLMSAAKHLEDFRLHRLDDSQLDVNVLKCIIWSLKEDEVKIYLREVLAPRKEPNLGGKRDTRKAAIVELQNWSEDTLKTNPLVLLSLAMESAGLETQAEDFCTGGPISFLELWQLTHNDSLKGSLRGLNSTTNMLLEDETNESSAVTADSVYEKLCRWKKDCSRDYQWKVLTMAMEMNSLMSHTDYLKKCRHEERLLPDEELEHILWNLRDFDRDNSRSYLASKVRTLLVKLGLGDTASSIKESDEMQETVKQATSFLSKWMTHGGQGINCVILLALSLEDAGFSPIDREFFIVDQTQKLPVDSPSIARLLTSVHREKLSRLIQKAGGKALHSAVEYEATLFDVPLMLQEWNDSQRCSNYEKRCKLNDAALSIERIDISESLSQHTFSGDSTAKKDKSTKGREGSAIGNLVSTAALNQLTTYLIPQFARKLCSKLKVNYKEDHTVGMLQTLLEWRNRASEKENSPNLRDFLSKTLNELHFSVSILTDTELKSLRDNAPLELHGPIINKLGLGKSVNTNELLPFLTDWRDAQLKDGKTFQECRTNLHSILESVAAPFTFVPLPVAKTHVYKVERVDTAFHLLMQDVYPLAEALGIHGSRLAKYRRPHNFNSGTLFLVEELFNTLKTRKALAEAFWKELYFDVAKYVSLDYEQSYSEMLAMTSDLTDEEMMMELPKHLGMRDVDVSACLDETGKLNRLEMFRLWKSMIHRVPYNYRANLDKALFSLGFKRAEAFETAALNTSLTSSEEAEPDQDHVLYELLLSDVRSFDNEQRKDAVRERIKLWLSNQKKHGNTELAQRVRENDSLLESGFVEVAREMMAIEYYLMSAKSFRPRKGFRRKSKMILKGEIRK